MYVIYFAVLLGVYVPAKWQGQEWEARSTGGGKDEGGRGGRTWDTQDGGNWEKRKKKTQW